MCGILGIMGPGIDVVEPAYLGLFALQHRGQESTGIAVGDGARVQVHRDTGNVTEVITPTVMSKLKGFVAIGHTRYSTTGAGGRENAHPLPFTHPSLGPGAIAHNGNLVNTEVLRRELEGDGARFTSQLDTEVMVRLIERTPGSDWQDVLRRAFVRVIGAYSCVISTADRLIAFRDPYGFRPLSVGVVRLGDRLAHVVASETCALDTLGAAFVREVRPGEMVIVDERECIFTDFQGAGRNALCIFEFVYFARPDSIMGGCEIEEARIGMGRELAVEQPVCADIVIGLPDSGIPAAIGYADVSGIPFREGLIKSRYSGRTFIQPSESLRELGVKLKLSPLRKSLKGKRVVAVDDSIVRGTTSRRAIQLLRQAGAAEVHLRVSSPPLRFPCFMGIDIGSARQLIATGRTVEAVRRRVGADSLGYLSKRGLMRALRPVQLDGFCRACFDGVYPIPLSDRTEEPMPRRLPDAFMDHRRS